MQDILSTPSPEVLADLAFLKQDLNLVIPAKQLDRNLLIATWNIRAFGEITRKEMAGAKDSPKRDYHSVLCIAEILSRFDVIAIQEVKENIKGLRDTLKVLGSHWSLILPILIKEMLGIANVLLTFLIREELIYRD